MQSQTPYLREILVSELPVEQGMGGGGERAGGGEGRGEGAGQRK